MQLRRGLIAFALVLAGVTVIATVSAPQEKDDPPPPTTAAPRAKTPPPVTVTFSHPVGKTPPERRVRDGEHVVVRVQAGVAGNVEIPGLGLIQPVEPGTPAVFDVLANRPGRYDVFLLSVAREQTRLGTLVVGD